MKNNCSVTGRIKNWFLEHPWNIKIVFCCINFCAIIFAYSMIKAVKDAIFLSMVGPAYQPYAKQAVIALSITVFMPIYYQLINRVQRRNICSVFTLFYAVFCLILCAAIMHPTIGIANTITSKWRLLGWACYIIFEFFNVAVVGTFWGLLNSISTPESSKSQYGTLAIASRVSGICASSLGLFLSSYFDKAVSFPIILIISSVALGVSYLAVGMMYKYTPEKYLTGYTSAHTTEKPKVRVSFLSGLQKFVQTPYVLGIFVLVCAIEIISTIMDYRMQCVICSTSASMAGSMLSKMFVYTLSFQIFGLFLAIFATTNLPSKIGIRSSLLITPVSTLLLVFAGFGADTLLSVMLIQIVIRGFNYGFYEPVREMLFVPTSTEIQFTVKGWIDTFGKTSSKAFGGMINIASTCLCLADQGYFLFAVACVVCIIWISSAFAVGTKYQKTINRDCVIE